MRKSVLVIVVLSILTGCSKLDSKDFGSIDPQTFPKTADDIRAMVYAVYNPLRSAWGTGINARDDTGIMYLKELQTGVLFDGDNDVSIMNYNPESEDVTRLYDDFVKFIGMMTQYIDIIQNSNIEGAEDEIDKAVAEIRCARGFLAYQLMTLYGPIVIAPLEMLNDPLNSDPLPRASKEEMVNFIESDLLASLNGLPTPDEVEFGKFSTGFARMLLIRLYLYEKEWKKVSDQCDSIINSHYYSLDANYVKMFQLGGAQASSEVIWGMPVNYEGMPNENQWQMIALPEAFAAVPGYGVIQSSWSFYDTFESGDLRKTYLIANFQGNDGIPYSRTNPGSVMNWGPLPVKMDPDPTRFSEFSGIDLVFYRYADVLLSKAEAIANLNSGPNADAMDLLNQIRSRAGLDDLDLSDYNTYDKFIDQLLTERSHEFWAETGDYRDDLIRYNKLLDKIFEVSKSQFVADYKILFPFSLKTVNEGKGVFVQNSGY